ncbi:MAG: DUF4870 domain-containing protein [Chloroflexota bacterium]
MAEEMETFEEPVASGGMGITDDDKLWALLSYLLWPLGSILVAVMEDKKARPYVKYHAIQAAGLGVAIWVIVMIVACVLGLVTFFIGGLGACCGFLPVLALFYYAYLAYQGDYFEIAYLTDFMVKQGWLTKPL